MATAAVPEPVDWHGLVAQSNAGPRARKAVIELLTALDDEGRLAGDPHATTRDAVRDRFVTLGQLFGLSADWHREIKAWAEDLTVATLRRLGEPTPSVATIERWKRGSWGWSRSEATQLALRAFPDKTPPPQIPLAGDLVELLDRVANSRRLLPRDRATARDLLAKLPPSQGAPR